MTTFEQFDRADVQALIREYPLAWMCAADGRADHASLLPLLGEYDAAGRLTHLVGHVARRNPLYAALRSAPRALVLFSGPNGYLSPSDAGKRDWAPTWNYAQLRLEVDIAFAPDEEMGAIDLLVDAMERERPDPWSVAELGSRYATMRQAIIAFRATVTAMRGTFKLGQDENPEVLATLLDRIDDLQLIDWMRRANRERLDQA